MTKPKDIIIIPDPSIKDCVVDYTESSAIEGGGPSAGVADANNDGNLSLFINGDPKYDTTTRTYKKSKYTFRVVDSGSLYSTHYVYSSHRHGVTPVQNQDEKGEHDRRFRYNFNNPFDLEAPTFGYGATAFFCKHNNREYVYQTNSTTTTLGTLRYAYRDITQKEYYGGEVDTTNHSDAWSGQGTVNLGGSPFYRGVSFGGSEACQIDTCVMQNGDIRMVVFYNYDLDVYESTDGINWTLIAEKILSRFLGRRANLRGLRLAQSGGWIKVIFAELTGGFGRFGSTCITGLVSSDGGATWYMTDEGILQPSTVNHTGEDPYSFDMCGYGDGAFLLVERAGGGSIIHWERKIENLTEEEVEELYPGTDINNQYYIATYISTAKNGFAEAEKLRIAAYAATPSGYQQLCSPRFFLCQGQDAVWLWLDGWKGGLINTLQGNAVDGMESRLLYINKNQSIENTKWVDCSKNWKEVQGEFVNQTFATTGYYGVKCFRLGKGKFFACGDGVAIFAPVWDSRMDLISYEKSPVYMRFSGWHNRPISQFFDDGQYDVNILPTNPYQPSGRMLLPEWDTSAGSPAGTLYGNGQTDSWKLDRLRTTSEWNTGRLKIEDLEAEVANPQRYLVEFSDSLNQGVKVDNWVFGSTAMDGVFGSCVEWVAFVECASSGGVSNSNGYSVEMKGFITKELTDGTNNYVLQLRCQVSPTGFSIININDSAASLTNYSVDFSSGYYEFRWSFNPTNNAYYAPNTNTPTMITDYTSGRNVLSWRKYGTDTWSNTGLIVNGVSTITGTLNSAYREQSVKFGHHQFTIGAGLGESYRRSYFKQFSVSNRGDLQQTYLTDLIADRPAENARRGRIVGSDPVYLDNQVSVVWGGVGGCENDEIQAEINFDYDPTNAFKFPSPRTKYMGTVSTTASETSFFSLQNNNESFNFDTVALFNVVGTTVNFDQSVNSNFSPYTRKAVSMDTKHSGILSAVNSKSRIEVTFNATGTQPLYSEYQSTPKDTYYIQFNNNVGGLANQKTYKIKQMDDAKYIVVEGGGLASAHVGSSFTIYSHKAVGTVPMIDDARYLRVHIEGADKFPTRQAQIGTMVLGRKMELDVPLSWEWSDDEKANIEEFNSRGGVRWSYRNGPSVRTLKGKMVGDVTEQQRRRIRTKLKSNAQYSCSPIVFYQNVGYYDPDRILLCNYSDQTNFENQGWYIESGRVVPVGDMSLTFIEVV